MKAWAGAPLESVVILAGGRSERMGQEKALVDVGGVTLIERLALRFAPRLERLLVSVAHTGPSEGLRAALGRCEATLAKRIEVVRDPVDGEGPLVGMAAALGEIEDAQAFFVAVDMPNASVELASELWRVALEHNALGVVPRWSRGLEPAFAVYSKCLLRHAETLIASGQRGLKALAAIPGVRILDLELSQALTSILGSPVDTAENLFRSLNTPADVEAWRAAHPGGLSLERGSAPPGH